MRFLMYTLSRRCEKRRIIIFSRHWRKITIACKFHFFEGLKSVRNDLKLSLHSPMVSLKKKSKSLMKYYIKVTCAFKWTRKLPRKRVTYESAKCVSCNTRKCTHNGFVSDLLKWALKCRFYATGPRARLHKTPVTVTGIRTCTRNLSQLH